MQYTIGQKLPVITDTIKQTADTLVHLLQRENTARKAITEIVNYSGQKETTADTVSLCRKDAIANVTFYDSANFIMSLRSRTENTFPFSFIQSNRAAQHLKREIIFKSFKDGEEIPANYYQADWLVPVILFALFMFAIVRTFPGSSFRNMLRFLLMRGVNENSSRDTVVLFQWQSTLLNFASFITISIFGYLMIVHYGITINGINGFLTWLAAFGIVVISITARHFMCYVTGSISGQLEIFKEYVIGIYYVYRAAGIILLIFSLLVLYTTFLPEKVFFITSFIVTGMLYLLRIVRLLLIFLTRHVSIFYLILYLCALEILPVVIIVKYVTGLV